MSESRSTAVDPVRANLRISVNGRGLWFSRRKIGPLDFGDTVFTCRASGRPMTCFVLACESNISI